MRPIGTLLPLHRKHRCSIAAKSVSYFPVNDETLQFPEEADDRFEIIATLDSEVEAQLVDAVLADRKIPHRMVTYYDSAYGGVFQGSGGWGRIEAPLRYRNEILSLIHEIQDQPPLLPPDDENDGAGTDPA